MFPYFCEDAYTKHLEKRKPPALEEIVKFMERAFALGKFNPECAIVCLIYTNQLLGTEFSCVSVLV